MHSNVIIKIPEGEYTQPHSISGLISYCTRKGDMLTGGYGFWPMTYTQAVEQFTRTYELQEAAPERMIWQLIIAFPKDVCKDTAWTLANQIAIFFSGQYQVLYSMHKTPHLHFHFAIASVSYHPEGEDLTYEKMLCFIQEICRLMESCQLIPTFIDDTQRGEEGCFQNTPIY